MPWATTVPEPLPRVRAAPGTGPPGRSWSVAARRSARPPGPATGPGCTARSRGVSSSYVSEASFHAAGVRRSPVAAGCGRATIRSPNRSRRMPVADVEQFVVVHAAMIGHRRGRRLTSAVVCAPGLSGRRTGQHGGAYRRPHSGQFCGWRYLPWLSPETARSHRICREIVLLRMRRTRNWRSCHDLAREAADRGPRSCPRRIDRDAAILCRPQHRPRSASPPAPRSTPRRGPLPCASRSISSSRPSATRRPGNARRHGRSSRRRSPAATRSGSRRPRTASSAT